MQRGSLTEKTPKTRVWSVLRDRTVLKDLSFAQVGQVSNLSFAQVGQVSNLSSLDGQVENLSYV